MLLIKIRLIQTSVYLYLQLFVESSYKDWWYPTSKNCILNQEKSKMWWDWRLEQIYCISVKIFQRRTPVQRPYVYYYFPHQVVSRGVCIGFQLGNKTNLGFWWNCRIFVHGWIRMRASPRGFHLISKRLKTVFASWCSANTQGTDGQNGIWILSET